MSKAPLPSAGLGKPPLTKAQATKIRASRDSKDPLYWLLQPGRLGPTQERYLLSTTLNRLVTGGNQTGKTTIGVADTCLILRGRHPIRKFPGPVRALILTQSRAQAAQVVGRKMFNESCLMGPMHDIPMIPEREIEELKTLSVGLTVPYSLKLKNGSEAIFAWSGVDATWSRIQGMEFDLADLDEDAGTPELMREIEARLIVSRSDPTKPYGGMKNWHATPTAGSEALQDFREKGNDPTAKDYEVFHIKAGENPAVSAEALDAFRETLGAKHFAVRGTGTKTATDLVAVYGDQWDDTKHIRAENYVPGETDNLWAVIDPGFAHPAGILHTALSKDDPHQIKVVEYHDVRGRSMEDWLRIIAEWLDGRWLDGLVLDPASYKTEYTGKSVFKQIEALLADPKTGVRMRNRLMVGRNRHWDGISRMRSYLKPPDRVEPLIVVNPTSQGCMLAVSQIKGYRGRASTKFTGEGGVVKKNDEAVDCLRYLVTCHPTWVNYGINRRLHVELSQPGDRPPKPEPVAIDPAVELHQRRILMSSNRLAGLESGESGVTFADL